MIRVRVHAPARLWLATGVMAGAVAALTVGWAADLAAYDTRIRVSWWSLAALFALAEIFVFHVQIRRETQTFSLSELPLVLALFFATPLDLIVGQLIGSALALTLYRRQPVIKAAYNLAQFALSSLVAVAAFRAIARVSETLGGAELVGAMTGTVLAILAGVAAVILAIAVTEGLPPARVILRNLGYGTIGTLANSALALITVLVLRVEPVNAWLLAMPAAIAFTAYRGYSNQRRRNERLAALSDATRIVEQQVSLEPAMTGVLRSARELIGGELAVIRFLADTPGEPMLMISMAGDHDAEICSVEPDPREGVWARVVAEGRGVLLARPMDNPRLHEHFAARGIRDAVVAPLWGRDGVTGTLLVGNRIGDVETFTKESLTLLETFANQVGTALENVRLLAKLQQIADELTEAGHRKDEALANVAHDMRNPLASMLSGINLLYEDDLEPEERRGLLEAVTVQGDQLRALIDELVGQAGTRRTARPVKPVDVRTLLNQVEMATAGVAIGHHLEIALDRWLPALETDPGAVARILGNLVANAYRYSPEGSTVIVSARADGRAAVVFSVSDQGVGIPEDLHRQIFERFFRGSDGRGGAGLGLSIARRLATEIGGKLWLERSTLGRGSEFRLWLPAHAPARVIPVPGSGQSSFTTRRA